MFNFEGWTKFHDDVFIQDCGPLLMMVTRCQRDDKWDYNVEDRIQECSHHGYGCASKEDAMKECYESSAISMRVFIEGLMEVHSQLTRDNPTKMKEEVER